MNLEGHSPGARERAGEQRPHGEEAESGNVPTGTAASCTSAPSPLLDLKETQAAAAAARVIPRDAPLARAIVLRLWGCLGCSGASDEWGCHTSYWRRGPDGGERPEAGEGLRAGEGLMLD